MSPSADPKAQLADLLLRCFDAGELRRHLGYLSDGVALTRRLPGPNASAAEIAVAAVDALDANDLIKGDEFWAMFKRERPRRVEEIERHRAMFRSAAAAVTPPATSERGPPDKLRILFLAASPIDVPRVDADQEFARIRDAVAHHPNLTPEVRSALTFARLRKALQEVRPHVLHITSHGTPGQLYFHRDDSGEYQAVPITAFARLLRALAKDLRLVVLNACHSLEIAEALVAEDPPITPWAIGMKTAIVDEDAIVFSNTLYDSLAGGAAIGDAHEAALAELELVEHPNPKLAKPPDIPRLVPDDPARAAKEILVRRG